LPSKPEKAWQVIVEKEGDYFPFLFLWVLESMKTCGLETTEYIINSTEYCHCEEREARRGNLKGIKNKTLYPSIFADGNGVFPLRNEGAPNP
jgi:hypothetical protein